MINRYETREPESRMAERSGQLSRDLVDPYSPIGHLITPREAQERELAIRAEGRMMPNERPFLLHAVRFATLGHQGQNRENGAPFIVHPKGVFIMLAERRHRPGVTVSTMELAVALNHDTEEDRKVSQDIFNRRFRTHFADTEDDRTIQELRVGIRAFDKNRPGDPLLRVAEAGHAATKAYDRLYSSYEDLRRLILDPKNEAHRARARRSFAKLLELRRIQKDIPADVQKDLDAAILLNETLLTGHVPMLAPTQAHRRSA